MTRDPKIDYEKTKLESDIADLVLSFQRRTGERVADLALQRDEEWCRTRDGYSFLASEELIALVLLQPRRPIQPMPNHGQPRWHTIDADNDEGDVFFNWNAVVRVWVYDGIAHVTFANNQTQKVPVERAKGLLPEYPWGRS